MLESSKDKLLQILCLVFGRDEFRQPLPCISRAFDEFTLSMAIQAVIADSRKSKVESRRKKKTASFCLNLFPKPVQHASQFCNIAKAHVACGGRDIFQTSANKQKILCLR